MGLFDSVTKEPKVMDSFHRHPVIIGNRRIPIFFRFTQNPNNLTFNLEKEYQETKTIGGYVFEMWGRKPIRLTGRVLIKKDNSWDRVLGLNTKLTNFDLEDHTYNPELIILQTLFNIDQRKMVEVGWMNTLSDWASGVKKSVTSAFTSSGNACKTGSSSDKDAALAKLSKDVDSYDIPPQTNVASLSASLTDTFIYYKGNIYLGFFKSMKYSEDGKTPFFNVVDFEFVCTGTFLDWIDTQITQTAAGRTLAALWGTTSSAITIGSELQNILGKL